MATRRSSAAPGRTTSSASGNLTPWLGIALVVVLLDQLVKALIVRFFHLGQLHTITSFFDLVRAHNPGAAFSFLAGQSGWQRWFFIALALAAVMFIVWMLKRHGGQRLFGWALALILGGAVGNVIDRVWHGYVVDFIQVHWKNVYYFPAFNVADSAISIGAGLLILDELMRVRRSK